MKKTIGILGGMGPRSTAPFLDAVVDACQEMTGAIHDMDFPQMVILSWPTPFYLDRPLNLEALEHAIVEGAVRLAGMGVDFIAMPCNTAHQFIPEIQKAIEVPVIDMVALTAERLLPEETALLATRSTVASGVYERGSAAIVFRTDWQEAVDGLIEGIKSGRSETVMRTDTDRFAQAIRQAGIRQVLIACTDLSTLDLSSRGFRVVDASKVLSEAVIKEWMR